MESNATTRKLNRLTARESYQLAEAVKEDADRLRKERPTLAEAAAGFTKTLGFRIGPSSIRTAMQATGVAWDTSGRTRRREPNRIDLDVTPSYSGEDEPAKFRFERCHRPWDNRICGVTFRRNAQPAEAAIWLRRLANLLDQHGAEFRAIIEDHSGGGDDPVAEENAIANEEKLMAGWNKIMASDRPAKLD